MKLYIFSSVKDKYNIPFRLFVINQNLKVVKLTTMLSIVACLALLLARYIFRFTAIKNHAQYRYGITFLLIASCLYYLTAHLIQKKHIGKRLFMKSLTGYTYPLFIIFTLMWISFVNGRSPADNMTLFMFGLIFVSVTWLFDIRSAIVTSIITFAGLSLGINYFLDSTAQVTHNIAALIIIAGFYFISRMVYSYHANYFIQLKLIERNNHEITKMGKLKTEMLGIVAHDLRSPLNSITALVELSKGANTTQTEREQYNNMILEGCEEAKNIIRDLILIVKGESSQTLQLRETNVNLLLSQVQQHWTHQMRDDKQILLTLPENVVTLSMDADKMLRVFDNLISNSIKFTDDSARIHLLLQQYDKSFIRITVSDNGIGVPENIQPYLFDRFSKAGRLGLKGEKSHGLGLNICKQIVEQHGGKISLESIAGEGSQFHILLPCNNTTSSDVKSTRNELSLVTIESQQ